MKNCIFRARHKLTYSSLLKFCLLILWAGTTNAESKSSEHSLTLSSGANATLKLPPAKSSARGMVIMIHGWSGQKDEVGDLFKRQAEALAERNIASLRMNIRGESEREATNYRLTSTFVSRVQDAQAGVDWTTKHYSQLPIGLLGFSYGGATAMELISQQPGLYKTLVLWSSILNPNELLLDQPAEPFRQALETGEGAIQDWTTLLITREHVLGMIGFNPMRGLPQYRGALLSLRGSEDSVPQHDPKILKQAGGTRLEYRILQGADHIFNAFDPTKRYGERIIEQTASWFEQTLPPIQAQATNPRQTTP
jgi:alpha/beta superfamily hydrolase